MKNPTVRHRGLSKGFSLVELMVAMVLGLVLLAGVINTFVANRQVYRTNDNMARIQETARIVNELMGREIRAAGGNPCGTPLVANVLNNPSSNWWSDWAGGALIGYDGTQAASFRPFGNNTADRVQGTDALLILTATAREGVTISSHNPAAAQFQLNTVNHGIDDGDILMVCDSSTAALFQVTNAQPGTNTTVVHNTGAGLATPGNCSKGLGFPTVCTTNGTPKDFSGGILAQLNASFWYIGRNGNGGTSLYRLSIRGNPGSSPPSVTSTTEEIVEDVTDMQIQYLTRNGNNLANSYVDATSITDWGNSATNLVVAARATLSLQTGENVSTAGSRITRTLSFTTSVRNREVVQ